MTYYRIANNFYVHAINVFNKTSLLLFIQKLLHCTYTYYSYTAFENCALKTESSCKLIRKLHLRVKQLGYSACSYIVISIFYIKKQLKESSE